MAVHSLRVGEKVYEFDPAKITNVEGMAIEKVIGTTFDQWHRDVAAGSPSAVTALVWMLGRRENPALRIGDVLFNLADVNVIDETDAGDNPPQPVEEIVPGGSLAQFDPADPTPAPEVSTAGAPVSSPPSPPSTASTPTASTV